MSSDSEPFKSPSQLLEALMKERGWSNRLLSVVLDVEENAVSRLVTGKRPIDAEIALTLEEVFSVPAERFLGLQKSYDLAKARIVQRPDTERATRAQLFGKIPVAEMIKRGWLRAKDVRDPQVQPELALFFDADSLDQVEALPHAAKRTQASIDPSPVQLAWLYRVRAIATEMLVPKYNEQALRHGISKLSQLLLSAEETRKVPRILAECGVRFLVVEGLPGSKIDGVCFWLNDAAPVIALTMRFDRIDNFWFVVRHEIEHVLRGHGKSHVMLDADIEGDASDREVSEEEKVANDAAANFCVPALKMKAFADRKAPFFNDRDILAFAKMINVHPGLVAGQIRRLTNQYERFNSYLVKVRTHVLPNAVSDGWGNVYPLER